MNLPMIMECLGMRYSDSIDVNALVEAGKNGVVNFSEVVAQKKNKKRNRKEKTDE